MKAGAIRFPGVSAAVVRKNPQIPFRLVMYYLKRYLDQDRTRYRDLRATFEKTTGAELQSTTLWRHLSLRQEPPATTFLIYLGFLHREKAIAVAPTGPELFAFTFPELMKAKTKTHG